MTKRWMTRAGVATLFCLGLAVFLWGSGARSQRSEEDKKQIAAAALGTFNVKRACTAVEVANRSRYPVGKVVFHYDDALGAELVKELKLQGTQLRYWGYVALTAPGGPGKAVQVYVAGKTSPKLIYTEQAIREKAPERYARAYYEKAIGKPEANAKAVLDKQIDELRQISERLGCNLAAQDKILEMLRQGEDPFKRGPPLASNEQRREPSTAWDLDTYCGLSASN